MQNRKKKFIEIGSCDFRTLRYLCNQGWEGVMVDPYQKYLDNIEDHDDLTKVCVAIGPERTTAKFHKVKDDVLKYSELDYRGMGSIDPKTPLLLDEYKGNIESLDVAVITFDDLVELTEIGTEIDFLKLDTEGMDLQIIQSIDFEKYDIKVILSEVRVHWEDHLKDYLENNGYLVQILYDDLFAVKLNLFEN
jgi:FkbM family methyltransferase